MVKKLTSLVKAVLYLLEYGKKISFRGFPTIHENVKINIKQGKMTIGKGFTAKAGTYFAVVRNGHLALGENVSFGRNCITVCHDSITIGNNVAIAPHVLIYDHDHNFNYEGLQEGFRTSPINIGDNCWIGAGAIILRGTTIGKGSIIGAGTVINGTIPPYSLVSSNRELKIQPLSDIKHV